MEDATRWKQQVGSDRNVVRVTLRDGSGFKLPKLKSQPSTAQRPESSDSGPHFFHWPIGVVA